MHSGDKNSDYVTRGARARAQKQKSNRKQKRTHKPTNKQKTYQIFINLHIIFIFVTDSGRRGAEFALTADDFFPPSFFARGKFGRWKFQCSPGLSRRWVVAAAPTMAGVGFAGGFLITLAH